MIHVKEHFGKPFFPGLRIQSLFGFSVFAESEQALREKELSAVRKMPGQELIRIANAIRRQLFSELEASGAPEQNPTSMQAWFLAYIAEESAERDVFQKDLESHFNIRRSTATQILQAMERKALIRREPVAHDRRAKKITLTQAAREVGRANRQRVEQIEARLLRGFGPEELQTLLCYLGRMRENME